MKRIAILYSELSGYMAACLRTLKANHNIELLVFKWPVVRDAPFDEARLFGWIDQLYEKTNLGADQILKIVDAFDPDLVFVPGWIDPDYLRVARTMKRRGVPVVAGCDTQWTGSVRQRVSTYLAPWYLHSAIDVLWVAGERQRAFARSLGYTSDKCWSGFYACDWNKFAGIHEARTQEAHKHQEKGCFLYVGRYCEEKGLRELVGAYGRYRNRVTDPWKLVCAGTGPLAALLDAASGIENRGFIQPDEIPALMSEADVFVLPSRKEPWGVVVQEAAASGLPLMCSSACGAAVHLLQDQYNGFLFETRDARYLATCMAQMHNLSPARRRQMGQRSHDLSMQYTPERWAQTLMEGMARLKEQPVEYETVSTN